MTPLDALCDYFETLSADNLDQLDNYYEESFNACHDS
jgi:hypothetical protein